jgi:eukaryotic-like serine/threonine-protein kinase
VTFPAPYGDERITVHLWLPKRSRPPFQVVVRFPGAGAWDVRSVRQELVNPRDEFLVKSGRALVLPIYKGSWERGTDQFRSDYPKETSVWRDHVIAWYKDLARTIDYLETRRDIAVDKLGYYGFSRGGAVAPLLLTLEPRVKAAVFVVPGFYLQRPSPEVRCHQLRATDEAAGPRSQRPLRLHVPGGDVAGAVRSASRNGR